MHPCSSNFCCSFCFIGCMLHYDPLPQGKRFFFFKIFVVFFCLIGCFITHPLLLSPPPIPYNFFFSKGFVAFFSVIGCTLTSTPLHPPQLTSTTSTCLLFILNSCIPVSQEAVEWISNTKLNSLYFSFI